MSVKKILLYHRLRSVKTIQDFIDHEYINIKAQELFDDNKDFIYKQMTESDKTAYKDSNGTYPTSSSDLNVNMTLPCPCNLLIDPKYITLETSINQTNLQVDEDDFYAFENEQIQDVKNEETSSGDVDKRVPSCQVIGWFKNIYKTYIQNDGFGLYGNVNLAYRNLSSDIISITTSVGRNGGNFSIRLPHIDIDARRIEQMVEMGENGRTYVDSITIKKSNKNYNFNKKQWNEKFGLDWFERNSFNSMKDYYSTLISSNDLLFISFHHNNVEVVNSRDNLMKLNNQNELSGSVIYGNYDMIGLVDEVKIITDSQGAQIGVEVSGRDLMKLIIEDGSFFFNPSVVADPSRIFWNDNKNGDIASVTNMGEEVNPLQRMIGGARDASNMISVFAHKQNMSIEFVLKTVLSQLTNIEVIPGDAFDGFPNRTTLLELNPKNKE